MPVTLGASSLPSTGRNMSKTLLLATDLQRSVLAELDRSGPNHLAYIPYGSQSSRFAAGSRLGFNGELKEQPTGWYHLGNGHRVYNPVLMRFHNPDRLSPFGKGGLNAYAYCEGDPVNFADPTGQYGAAIARLIQQGATIALHAGIVTTNLVGAKAAGWMLYAARISTVASSTAIVGAVGQLAGLPAAIYVSNAATTVSAIATMVRYVPAIVNRAREGALRQTVVDNVRNLAFGTAFPTPVPNRASGDVTFPLENVPPAVSPSVSNFASVIRSGEEGSRRAGK